MKVSLCLIVKDEEQHLGTCLNAFRDIYDELIVVDTGSTDSTKSIVKEFGTQVFDFEWINDFAAARNFALSKATGDWVMTLDADDAIEKENAVALRKLLEENADGYSVISLPYVYHQSGGNAGNTATLPRLWKRELGLKYVYPIHEYVDVSQVPLNQIKKPDLPIIHNKTPDDFASSFARNVKILEDYIAKHPGDLRILYYLVHDNKWLGQYGEAVKWAEEYVKADPKDQSKLSKLLVHKGQCHVKLGETMKSAESFAAALKADPNLIDPYLYLGDLLFRVDQHNEAIQLYEKAMSCRFPSGPAFHNKAMYDYFAIRKLCYILPLVGRHAEALKYAEETLKFTPNDQKLITHIASLKKKT